MTLYKPSELHFRLETLGVNAKKGLSQNFLVDGNIIRKIIATSGVQAGDTVIEIGSGPGALTQALLQCGARVIAIEKDKTFANALNTLQTDDGRLEIIEADVLKIPPSALFRDGKNKAKIVANLPYHITTPIISRFVPLSAALSSLTVMVQKEVAERMTAKKGTAEYGSLTVFLDYYATTRYGFSVSPTCFFPRPKVHSAVVNLYPKQPAEAIDEEQFFQFTRATFQMRRKMLRSSLRGRYGAALLEHAFANAGIRPESRPEELSLEDFLNLFRFLSPSS